LGDVVTEELGQQATDESVCFLCFGVAGGDAGADRPDGFVGDDGAQRVVGGKPGVGAIDLPA